jgi:hypothetical protein
MTRRERAPLKDFNGHPIAVGDTVRQRNIFDGSGGALMSNARQLGVVTDNTGMTRIKVDFNREASYAFRGSGKPAPPIAIRAEYVEVVPPTAGD